MRINESAFKRTMTDGGIVYQGIFLLDKPFHHLQVWIEYQGLDNFGREPNHEGTCHLVRNDVVPRQILLLDTIRVKDSENPIPCLINGLERIEEQLISRLFHLRPKYSQELVALG